MSKIGFISDIHGNYPALEIVLKTLYELKCDQIICLGDISGYYSMVNECIELLIRKDVICLKGNHDCYLIGETSCQRSRTVSKCITYQQKNIRPEYFKWLKQLKPIYETNEFYAVHGGLRDPIDEYINDFDFNMAAQLQPRHNVFVSGHSHVADIQIQNNLIYCNPGSVGQPRDGDSRAAFAVFENKKFEIYRVEYNIDKIVENMRAAGFEEYYYKNLYIGRKIGEE